MDLCVLPVTTPVFEFVFLFIIGRGNLKSAARPHRVLINHILQLLKKSLNSSVTSTPQFQFALQALMNARKVMVRLCLNVLKKYSKIVWNVFSVV